MSSGNNNKSSINFFDNVFTFHNESVTVNCCHENNTLELAACGLGASCAGTCSALGAVLCPSGNCSGSCEMPFEEEEAEEATSRRKPSSQATKPITAFKWCSPRCNVWRNKGCCYNPVCKKKRSRACRWINFLTGKIVRFQTDLNLNLFRKHLPAAWLFAEWELVLSVEGAPCLWNKFPG